MIRARAAEGAVRTVTNSLLSKSTAMPQKKTKKQLEAEAAAEAAQKQAELEEKQRQEQVRIFS